MRRPVNRSRQLARTALLGLCVAAAACAVSTARRHGQEAERRLDYDAAVVEYTKALRLRPNDAGIRLALDRAKIRAAETHFERGRRLAALDKLDEALVEYQLASELNPTSGTVDQALRSTRNQLRARPSSRRWSNARATCLRPASICRPTSGCRPR
jgi:tetratricopeptide (TPR) repeat protein